MGQLVNINTANSILEEFYNVVKVKYRTKSVIINSKTFHYDYDKYLKDDTIPDTNGDKFKLGIIVIDVCFLTKCIELKFQIKGFDNLQGGQSFIALRTRIISRERKYYFTLHNYVRNRFQPFSDYSKDWTSFGKSFTGIPDLESVTNKTFANLDSLIETKEMQLILDTDYEPVIPSDYEIKDVNFLLDEFYRLVKQTFNEVCVIMKDKSFSDSQCHFKYTTPDMHNENYDFDYGSCNVCIVFKNKIINISVSIHSERNIYTDHNIYTNVFVYSKLSDYRFHLHDYIVDCKGPFKEYKEDWTKFEEDLSKFSNLEEATFKYFKQLKCLIATTKMQCILNTDYCPEIPIDWSQCGYK